MYKNEAQVITLEVQRNGFLLAKGQLDVDQSQGMEEDLPDADQDVLLLILINEEMESGDLPSCWHLDLEQDLIIIQPVDGRLFVVDIDLRVPLFDCLRIAIKAREENIGDLFRRLKIVKILVDHR